MGELKQPPYSYKTGLNLVTVFIWDENYSDYEIKILGLISRFFVLIILKISNGPKSVLLIIQCNATCIKQLL